MFIAKNNDRIVLARDTREELEKDLLFIVYTSIEETDIAYELYDGEYLTPEEIALKEEEKINDLTMTALDLVTYIKKLGVSDEAILQYLQVNPSVQLQLTLCQNVYCGVVRQLCPIKVTEELTITDEQVVNMFKNKHKITERN